MNSFWVFVEKVDGTLMHFNGNSRIFFGVICGEGDFQGYKISLVSKHLVRWFQYLLRRTLECVEYLKLFRVFGLKSKLCK